MCVWGRGGGGLFVFGEPGLTSVCHSRPSAHMNEHSEKTLNSVGMTRKGRSKKKKD